MIRFVLLCVYLPKHRVHMFCIVCDGFMFDCSLRQQDGAEKHLAHVQM
jgi:hypothetical protein